jgi:UDPglucose 6-dehydrogenase
MKISVIGLGYLGATHAVAMAKLGHEVIGIDKDVSKVESLLAGKIPFFEPGLAEALAEVLAQGKVQFQVSHSESSASADLHFLCVGTPQASDGSANTSYLDAAIDDLAPHLSPSAVVVGKSTVPVGTARKLRDRLQEKTGFEPKLVWNPEFLREGTALEDSLKPDRIVVGSFKKEDSFPLLVAYEKLLQAGSPLVELDVPTAELVKVAANAFLATKISFINAMAEIAEVAGADVVALSKAIGYDERIGNKFLRSGIGFGGGCLPKDIRGFISRAEELGVGQALSFLKEIDGINNRRRQRVIELAKQELGELSGQKITVLGVSFKPNSDDLRESPSLEIARSLARAGAIVTVTDPKALHGLSDSQLSKVSDVDQALRGSELVMLGTEWDEYRRLDPLKAKSLVKSATIIDGRNVLDVAAWQSAGWKVIALGRTISND